MATFIRGTSPRPTATPAFDWTDAAVSHPFVDLATYVFRTDDQTVRRRLADAYVGFWSAVSPERTLREAVTLARSSARCSRCRRTGPWFQR